MLPIEYIIELVFVYFYRAVNNAGAVLILVSLFVCLVTLPLYLRAEEIQKAEKKKQKGMEGWISHIKKTFAKDERFFIMQAYYREKRYRPADSLRGSLSILIQIPFFMAAYHYLSNLEILKESDFLFIGNLGMPDALVHIGGLSINILPVVMTLINIASGLLYTKGRDLMEMIKISALALIFMVLLYNSPAGLVIYWTCNNLFSLCKNIVVGMIEKYPRYSKGIRISLAGILIAAVLFVLFGINYSKYPGETIFTALLILFQIPLFILAYRERNNEAKSSTAVFLFSQAVLTVLIGVWMPASAVFSSPIEFVRAGVVADPLSYMTDTLYVAAGLFMIWIPLVFFLLKDRGRFILEIISSSSSVLAVIHGFFLDQGIGQISSDLEVLDFTSYPEIYDTLSMMISFIIPIMIYFVLTRKRKILLFTLMIMLATVSFFSIKDIALTKVKTAEYYRSVDTEIKANKLPLTRSGKNVIVLMLDRAINAYIPYMLQERPELKEKLDGFTYYPNTLSFAGSTYNGSQALFGGYDYTPERLNERSGQTLQEKQTEALLMLPRVFSDEGFEVTVVDPPYAGYKWYSDLSIYEDYPQINAMLISDYGLKSSNAEQSAKNLKRNFLYYSIFRCVPYAYRSFVYDEGFYWSLKKDVVKYTFYNAYNAIENLKGLTEINDDGKDSVLLLDNETPHNTMILSQPDYVPYFVDESMNRKYAAEHDHEFVENPNYHPNICAILRVTEWFDYLRENGVWDNTRIIVVSDHGYPNGDFPDMLFGDGLDVEAYNPLLMVKDFGSKGFRISEEFMTNADVPSLAVKDLIEDPVNPFTKNAISMDDKYSKDGLLICDTGQIVWENGEFVLPKGNTLYDDRTVFYRVKGDMFDKNSWKKVSR
ncbi:MAG: YidC/Oxa1 family membrane protein insertase [Lachnospiraceae bacterium]|nr:YidC/Oxa1 family membrane protein insertase [Lachnospiraceae bacterium]